ncbi:MAG: hypothetical protein K6E86_02160 [Bacteroidales bacterium]|nr:hypothetical protein [Bacteroidales bacterium]
MKDRYTSKRKGMSYAKRVHDVNCIYDHWAKLGYPNRTIWRNWIWPVFCISERTFYNMLKVSEEPRVQLPGAVQLCLDFDNPTKDNRDGEGT